MFKITVILSLMLIATWSHADTSRYKREAASSRDYDTGSTLWVASLSCDSCGSECASACGTRHFRSCCFNYLRKKRGPDNFKLLSRSLQNFKPEYMGKKPPTLVQDVPWNIMPDDFSLYPYEDAVENRFESMYE